MSHFGSARKRRGLTLMQLLVLLALLLFLLGFLLAATARFRNASESVTSRNNLHQIMVGLINFANSPVDKLPPGSATWFPKKGLVANNSYGPCLFHILPFLEQDPLYKSTRKNIDGKPVYASWEAAGKSVKVFMAPGDPTWEQGSDRTSYLANELALPETGARLPNSFPDGISNTILIAEGYSQATDTVTFGGQTTTWKTDRRWWDNSTWKPAAGAVMFQVAPPVDAASSMLPQGFTPDSINVGLADGSVRTVDASCSSTTFYAACTPAGNDVLGNDW
ncbi:MAG: DUF1559 domain-containing protein [Planctomycetes bacterium]|nr:DUF1559 domain-containing protein [Planctomycetota bacterium]